MRGLRYFLSGAMASNKPRMDEIVYLIFPVHPISKRFCYQRHINHTLHPLFFFDIKQKREGVQALHCLSTFTTTSI
jgi:hypothetical protein